MLKKKKLMDILGSPRDLSDADVFSWSGNDNFPTSDTVRNVGNPLDKGVRDTMEEAATPVQPPRSEMGIGQKIQGIMKKPEPQPALPKSMSAS